MISCLRSVVRVFVFFGYFCLPLSVYCQQTVVDSIHLLLFQLPDDSARIEWCITESRRSNALVAGAYIKEGKLLAKKHHDTLSLAKLISEEGILANVGGQHVLGAQYFLRTDSLYRLLRDSMLIAGAQTNAGLSYYHAGQYDQALTHYFEAYRMYEHQEPSTGFSRLLNNLAMCYKQTEKPGEALKYYRESLSIKRHLNDSLGYAHTLHNLALLLNQQGETEDAIQAFDTAIIYYRVLGRSEDEASSTVALGKVLIDIGQHERAERYLRDGYGYFHSVLPGSRQLMLAAWELGRLQIKREQWHLADQYIEEALASAMQGDELHDRASLLEAKAEISHHLGRSEIAYAALREAFSLKDSVYAQQRLALTEEMQTRFSVREKEKDLELTELALENQQRVAQLYRMGFFVAIVIGLIIAALGIFLYRSRKEIQRNQKVIANALSEKELLLKEIHHRVKNNLQIISSLLSMQAYQSRDPNVSDAMREGQNRVRSMALIHQNLYQNASFVAVEASHYIYGLVDNLRQAYRLDTDRITMEAAIDDIRVDVDTMIPLGLIVNELVTNSLKHAFPDGRNGRITVGLHAMNGVLELSVKDNGIGVDVNRLKTSQSMGMTLISDFCLKLKADLQVNSDSGTEVLLRIPNASYTHD